MYLRIRGDCFSENMFKEIGAITNCGILHFEKVEYNKEAKMISIPIERCKIKTVKKIFGGTTTSFKYDKTINIPSLITIRNITDCVIENNLNDLNISEVRMLFGLIVKSKNKEMYIGSVEENEGKTCYSITVKVGDIDIEISDMYVQ